MLKSKSNNVKIKGLDMSDDVRVTIRIPEQLKGKVKEVANSLNMSFNDAIKAILFAGLK